jgi:hypothetical protein
VDRRGEVVGVKITRGQATAQAKIAAALGEVGFALPGTLSTQSYRCGKTNCRCHAEPPTLHGPYVQWTRKINNKTVTRRLSAEELSEYQQLFDNAKRLRGLVADLQALTLSLVEEKSPTARERTSSEATRRRKR